MRKVAALCFVALCWACRAAAQIPGGELYLLTGTTTQHSDEAYPARLYRVNGRRKLELAREVVSGADGIRYVYAWAGTIFLLYPHYSATKASIIHTDDPLRADDLAVCGRDPMVSAVGAATPTGSSVVLLAPWVTNLDDPAHPPTSFKVVLATLSSDMSDRPRVRLGEWSDYRYLRTEGAYGGPNYVAAFIGTAQGDQLTLVSFSHVVNIGKLPADLRGATGQAVPVVAASGHRLIVTRQHTWEEMRGGKLGRLTRLYVYDREQNFWSSVQAEGNSSTLRYFEPWLVAIVGDWSERHREPNPGRESERSELQKTDVLPPVQTLFQSFVGSNIVFPGILTLQNLADGRKIRIETGQEDSEILRVEGDAVLYRVNDSIFQARIVGDQLKETTLIVKDEDVPEVHWAFWSH